MANRNPHKVLPDGTLQKSGPLALLVTKKSATTTGVTTVLDEDNIPLNTDHSGLVKFQSRAHDDYCTVRERIRVLVSRATSLPEDEGMQILVPRRTYSLTDAALFLEHLLGPNRSKSGGRVTYNTGPPSQATST